MAPCAALLGVFVLLLSHASTAHVQRDASDTRPTVAIVGAGISGSTAAHYLNRMLGDGAVIHVYEKDNIGGRAQSFDLDDDVHELGAAMFVKENRYMVDLVQQMNLTLAEPLTAFPAGLWDGANFVFNESDSKWATAYRLARRYGLDAYRLNSASWDVFRKLDAVYGLQEEGRAFETPEALLAELGLLEMTQVSHEEFLKGRLGRGGRGNELLEEELVSAANGCNYNQENSELNALAGTASMFPLATAQAYRVKEGNVRLMQQLLISSGSHIHPTSMVTEVFKYAEGGYMLWVKREPEGAEPGSQDMSEVEPRLEGPFDYVIIAAPIEVTGMAFSEMPCERPPNQGRTFQFVVTSYVRGLLRPEYFGVETVPDSVLTTRKGAREEPFGSVQTVRKFEDGTHFYKVFSHAPIEPETMQKVFKNVTWAGAQPWHAYPAFSPPEAFSSFRICEDVYYVNSFENAVSTMETQAIAARNVALLVVEAMNAPEEEEGGGRRGREGRGMSQGRRSSEPEPVDCCCELPYIQAPPHRTPPVLSAAGESSLANTTLYRV